MPKLSELTDYSPEEQVTPSGRLYVSPSMPTSEDGDYFTKPLPVASIAPATSDDYFTKPVAPMPELGSNNVVERIIKKLAETEFSGGTDIGNKLTGSGGQERYQLWPEKIVRSALTAIPDAYSGKIPMHDVNPETGELEPSQAMIGRALDMATFAGVGGLGGTGEGGLVLGAGPSLRPALKYKDRLYKGKEGQQHMDVIPPHLYPEFQDMAMRGEDISHYNFGFVNDKGHFLSREDALKYGIDSGLIDPQAGKFGALTSTLMADSSKPGTAIEAMAKTAQPFYSALEHNVNAINQSKMNGEAWLGTLSNKPGVKPEELDWTGLRSFLEENKGKPVTKEQVQEHLASNKVELKEVNKGGEAGTKEKAFELAKEHGWKSWDEIDASTQAKYMQRASKEAGENPTKYHSYQLPGGENYREMLMTLPEKTDKGLTGWDKITAPSQNYKSSHWDEPNILAHVRMNDRTIDGKKSLHLEEIQSDWHQQGRDKGYRNPKIDAAIERLKNNKQTDEDLELLNSTGMTTSDYKNSGVPDAPFKKTWHELALKRMLREAAEKGYDRLSWTPGEAQAARYDLSKQIKGLEYFPEKRALDMIDNKGNRQTTHEMTPEKLPDFVGKEAAKKLLETEANRKYSGFDTYGPKHELHGVDLKIGGEGMKGFYDKIIPKSVNKLAKEYGAKVEVGKTKDGHSVFYIDLPQKLKDTAMGKGFPLFSSGLPYKFTPVDFDPFEDKKK